MKFPLIPYRYAKNPHSVFAKWLQLTPCKQWGLLGLCGLLLSYYPFSQYYQHTELQNQLIIDIQQNQEDLQHQQRLLQSIQQHSENRILTPEIAARLPPINQQIQQLLLHHRQQLIHHQWSFFSSPTLDLQIKGQFMNFQQFLTALLTEFPQLKLSQLQITKSDDEESAGFIHCILLFQLTL